MNRASPPAASARYAEGCGIPLGVAFYVMVFAE
jgi:hypothetical protein